MKNDVEYSNLLVHCIRGRADIGTRDIIDFSSSDAPELLSEAFAQAITQRWEGFVLGLLRSRNWLWRMASSRPACRGPLEPEATSLLALAQRSQRLRLAGSKALEIEDGKWIQCCYCRVVLLPGLHRAQYSPELSGGDAQGPYKGPVAYPGPERFG
jgi:hypothetical protein